MTTEGKKDGAFPSRPYGSYLVISTKHISSSDCNYTNVFKAIPAGVKVLPTPEAKQPLAYSEIARVLSNEDPDGKGRVQVQTQWQEKAEGLSTSWVRVMTPNAGKSDLHPKNRGMVFIPEVGDEVMLGYRYGDPSRPYVAGSMFHGMNGAGGDKDNVIKSIITRSGHELVFDDTKGKEGIVITDKNGNSFSIDTSGNSINIKALDTITLAATHINLVAAGTVNVQATAAYNLNTLNKLENVTQNSVLRTNDLTNFVENNFSSTAKNINQIAHDSISSKAKDKISISAKNKLDQKGGEVDVSAKKGKVRVVSKSANTEIKGKQVKLN